MQIKEFSPRFQQFMNWLNEEDALYEFFTAVGSGTFRDFQWLESPPKEWINHSMEWSETDNGHSFWQEKHDAWSRWLLNNPPEIDWQNELDSFLVENNAYQSYYKYCEEDQENPFTKEVEDLIDSVFDWDETDEGESFWDDLNGKWYRHVCEMNNRLKEELHRIDVTITIPDDWAFNTPITKGTSTASIPEPFMPGNVDYR